MSGAPSTKASRAPVTTRKSPIAARFSRAKTCARTTPASVLRSAIPIPVKPRAAARATSSSGCEAPRRNEKFVVVASSAKRGASRIMGEDPHPAFGHLLPQEREKVRSPSPALAGEGLGLGRSLRHHLDRSEAGAAEALGPIHVLSGRRR